MKKCFTIFISILFLFLNVSPCFALTKLYYVENVNKSSAAKLVENVLTEKEYTIKKKDPYYAVSINEPINYSIIVLQQDGNNLYYYYNSNNSKKNVNKAIIKYFKTRDLNCEERENEQLLQNFANIAQRTLTGKKKTYTFEDTTPQKAQNVQSVNAPQSPTTLKGFVGKTGKGDTLDIYIQNAINTATASVGDNVIGVLQSDWKTADNHVIAQQGSLLEGQIVKAHSAQIGMRNGLVELVFNKLTTPEGKTYDIRTKEVEFNVTNEGVVKEKVSSVAVAAITGAALGALFGLLGGGGSEVWQGAAIGAGIGGGGAAIMGAAEKGIDAEIPAYTQVQVVLKNDVDVVINY